jgi:ubiquinone/menaquinone biosynthesis C-methylase UbiE
MKDRSKKVELERASIYFAHFQNYIHENSKILEVGPGTGALLFYLNQVRNAKCTGLDVAINRQFDAPVLKYDGRMFPFKNQSFDHGVCIYVLHHTRFQDSVIREMKRVVRDKIIIFEDIWNNLPEKIQLYRYHIRFDVFMTVLKWFKKAEYGESFRYYFKTNSQWLSYFNILELDLIEEKPIVTEKKYPVPHMMYILRNRKSD